MKVQLTSEAKKKVLMAIVKKAIKLKPPIKIVEKYDMITGPFYISLETKKKVYKKSWRGTKEVIAKVMIPLISIKSNSTDYISLFSDIEWFPLKIKSHKELYDNTAIYIAQELEKLGLDVTLAINNKKKLVQLRNKDNPSRR